MESSELARQKPKCWTIQVCRGDQTDNFKRHANGELRKICCERCFADTDPVTVMAVSDHEVEIEEAEGRATAAEQGWTTAEFELERLRQDVDVVTELLRLGQSPQVIAEALRIRQSSQPSASQ